MKKEFYIIICLLLSAIFSVLIISCSFFFALAIFAVIILMSISVYKPEIGILIITIITSSIIFEDQLPRLPFANGSFRTPDLMLFFLFLVLFFRLIADRRFFFQHTNLDKPLTFFYLSAITSMILAITKFSVVLHFAASELRMLTYYLMFFLVTNFIREKKQLLFMLKGLFSIAMLVAIFMIIQAIFGQSIRLLPGRVETLDIFGSRIMGVTRILPPGQTLIYVIFITLICVIALRKSKFFQPLNFFKLGTIGISLVLTYNRNYWVAICFALAIFFTLISKKHKGRILAFIFMGMILLAAFLPLMISSEAIYKKFVNPAVERAMTLFTGKQLLYSSSLEYRKIEDKYAVEQIIRHPLLGIGLGNEYRPRVFGKDDDLMGYIHNGYLSIILRTGIIGFSFFLWFSLALLIRGFKNWKRVKDDFLKSILIGFTLSYVGLMLAAIVNPMFTQRSSIIVIVLTAASIELIIKFNEHEREEINENLDFDR